MGNVLNLVQEDTVHFPGYHPAFDVFIQLFIATQRLFVYIFKVNDNDLLLFPFNQKVQVFRCQSEKGAPRYLLMADRNGRPIVLDVQQFFQLTGVKSTVFRCVATIVPSRSEP